MLYTYYGDDFTGSTDVLEQLVSNGIPAVLFLGSLTPEHLARFSDVQAIGIAGDSRSRSPEWMSTHLPGIFSTLKSFHAPVNHYKVCSTFDSSPTHGSIGRAIEIGQQVFTPRFVPIVVGAPHLRRYVVFGNLFAAAPSGQIERIDRHPMAHHPSTPMREADLRRHLHAQTSTSIGLIDLITLQQSRQQDELQRQLEAGHQAILFDGIDEQTLAATGNLLWSEAQKDPIFSASSSGLASALIAAWREAGMMPPTPPAPHPARRRGPLLVISGSCSPVTSGQIRTALQNGFRGIPLQPRSIHEPAAFAAALSAAVTSLAAGQDTVLYTALDLPELSVPGEILGPVLGRLLHAIVRQIGISRILFCGGDTSSHAIQQLGLYALTWAANIQPGVPLCRTHSDDPALHHIELALKGGQIGTPDFFSVVRNI